jgi:hypothetical protein
MTQDETANEKLEDRVTELEERVAELEQKQGANSNDDRGVLDRYDRYVTDRVESVTDASPRRLMALYEESGIVDKKKKKRRVKRLPKVVADA